MLWRSLVSPGDCIIDATLGNGHDAFALLTMLDGLGFFIGYDIQEKSIISTKELLQSLPFSPKLQIELRQQCHSKIEANNPKLIVYNLGYLPGSDKTLTTRVSTTLISIQRAQEILQKQGMISITLYPGHKEGEEEQEALIHYVTSLPKKEWNVSWMKWLNRTKAPSLLLLQKM